MAAIIHFWHRHADTLQACAIAAFYLGACLWLYLHPPGIE